MGNDALEMRRRGGGVDLLRVPRLEDLKMRHKRREGKKKGKKKKERTKKIDLER